MTADFRSIIEKYYPGGSRLRDILVSHSRQVADRALDIDRRLSLGLDPETVEAAAMLHDIGIFLTDAPGIDCHGSEPYLRHGLLGAALLRDEGVDETFARVAERHTGAGITAEDIRKLGLPLPVRDFTPETLLERLICYADKFYSKNAIGIEKPLDRVRASMLRHSPDTLRRFDRLHAEFGA